MKRIISAVLRNVNLLNLLLAAAIVVSINYAVLPYLNKGVGVPIPSGKASDAGGEETVPPTPASQQADYLIVAENNLFHPERKIPIEQKDKEAQPLPVPELTLFGTVVAEGAGVAFVEDKKAPVTTAGRGQRQTVLKQGDAIGGFVLREVHSDRIVLTRGEEKMVVRLDEGHKQRSTETTGRAAAATGPAAGQTAAPARGVTAAPAQPVPGQSGVAPQVPGAEPVQRRVSPPAPRTRPTMTPGENVPAGR